MSEYQEKIDKFVSAVLDLDEGDLIEALREVCIASPETVIDLKLAVQDVLDGWKDIQEEMKA
jgi:hypothetical protein